MGIAVAAAFGGQKALDEAIPEGEQARSEVGYRWWLDGPEKANGHSA